MPVDPFAPSTRLLDRTLVFADESGGIQQLDESVLTQDGTTMTAEWQSPTLNRQDRSYAFSLVKLWLQYSATSSTTITVEASGDGGTTWIARDQDTGDAATTAIDDTGDEVRTVVVGFTVTGYDLRFRIKFTTNVAVKIHSYKPLLVRRGLLDASDYATPSP